MNKYIKICISDASGQSEFVFKQLSVVVMWEAHTEFGQQSVNIECKCDQELIRN